MVKLCLNFYRRLKPMSLNRVNNRTNINTYILLKRTEYSEKKLDTLEKRLDELVSLISDLESEVDVTVLTQTIFASDFMRDLFTSHLVNMNVSLFCRVMNEIQSTGDFTFSDGIDLVITQENAIETFTPITNPSIKTLSFGNFGNQNNKLITFNNLSNMFNGNTTLTSLKFPVKFNEGALGDDSNFNASDMFTGCTKLTLITAYDDLMYRIVHFPTSGIKDPNDNVESQNNVDSYHDYSLSWDTHDECLIVTKCE